MIFRKSYELSRGKNVTRIFLEFFLKIIPRLILIKTNEKIILVLLRHY